MAIMLFQINTKKNIVIVNARLVRIFVITNDQFYFYFILQIRCILTKSQWSIDGVWNWNYRRNWTQFFLYQSAFWLLKKLKNSFKCCIYEKTRKQIISDSLSLLQKINRKKDKIIMKMFWRRVYLATGIYQIQLLQLL